MAKKIVKKNKIKILPFIIFFIICFLLYFLIKFALEYKIQNIYIHGTKNLNDEYILSLSGIENYPSFLTSLSTKIENNIKLSPYIKSVTVKKGFLGVVNIYVEEKSILFYKENDKKYVFDDFKEIDKIMYNYSPVRVISYIPDTVYENFIKAFSKTDVNVRDKISEIKYDPSEYDDSRFLLYMIDGNYVYITVTKMDSLNYYNEIYPTLMGKKGTLYLDSGNHFQEFK